MCIRDSLERLHQWPQSWWSADAQPSNQLIGWPDRRDIAGIRLQALHQSKGGRADLLTPQLLSLGNQLLQQRRILQGSDPQRAADAPAPPPSHAITGGPAAELEQGLHPLGSAAFATGHKPQLLFIARGDLTPQAQGEAKGAAFTCLLYTSPSPRD